MTEEEIQLEKARLDLDRERLKIESSLRVQELELKHKIESRAAWRSPLFLAVTAAVIGLIGNAVVAIINGESQRTLERQKAEAARILQALETGDPDSAAENLKLLVDTKLVHEAASDIQTYLKNRKPGEGASLPSQTAAQITHGRFAPFKPSTSEGFCEQVLYYGVPSHGRKAYCRIGYAFAFNSQTRLAEWVAYRISKTRPKRDIPRGRDQWYLDPELPAEVQAGPEAYKQNDWDRGNLIRRMDATWSDIANREIWFYSVAAPQHVSLNRNIWLKLERATSDAVQEGRVDELLIFSGPVFGPNSIRNYRGMVDIPDGYFRIALDIKSERVAAWIVPNGPIGESEYEGDVNEVDPLIKYQVSVSDVEKATNLKFFNLLPRAEQREIKTRTNPVTWLIQ